MSAPTTDRPQKPMLLPDRRSNRRPTPTGNTMPWHPVTNPFGLAGVRFPGPNLDQR